MDFPPIFLCYDKLGLTDLGPGKSSGFRVWVGHTGRGRSLSSIWGNRAVPPGLWGQHEERRVWRWPWRPPVTPRPFLHCLEVSTVTSRFIPGETEDTEQVSRSSQVV